MSQPILRLAAKLRIQSWASGNLKISSLAPTSSHKSKKSVKHLTQVQGIELRFPHWWILHMVVNFKFLTLFLLFHVG